MRYVVPHLNNIVSVVFAVYVVVYVEMCLYKHGSTQSFGPCQRLVLEFGVFPLVMLCIVRHCLNILLRLL